MKPILLIPTLGHSPFLDAAVASAQALGEGWRVMLVGPAARADDLRRRFPRCEVVAETGRGLFGAINDGLRSAGGWERFSYLNDDDLVGPAVSQESDAKADIIYGRVDYIGADGRRLGSFPIEPSPERLPILLAAGIPALTPQGTVISRRAWETLGGFDAGLQFCGDFDFWLRAARQSLVLAHRPEPVGAFRLHPDQLSQQRESAAAELDRVCAKYRDDYSVAALRFARLGFRMRNLPLIFERRRLTGSWRSRDLFTKPQA